MKLKFAFVSRASDLIFATQVGWGIMILSSTITGLSNGCRSKALQTGVYSNQNAHDIEFWEYRFPIREYGMNYESQPLQPQEIARMKSDSLILGRIVKSYQLMLDFYGMRLVSHESGLVERAQPPQKCATRYRNLMREDALSLVCTADT